MKREETIIETVVKVFDITEYLLIKGDTAQKYTLARSALANLLHLSGYSIPQIAEIVRRRVPTIENDYLRFQKVRLQQVESYRERFIKCMNELKIEE